MDNKELKELRNAILLEAKRRIELVRNAMDELVICRHTPDQQQLMFSLLNVAKYIDAAYPHNGALLNPDELMFTTSTYWAMLAKFGINLMAIGKLKFDLNKDFILPYLEAALSELHTIENTIKEKRRL